MTKETDHAGADAVKSARSRTQLDEANFIRSKLFAKDQSAFQRYRSLVFHDFSWPKLLRYELLVTFFGPLPGALGLVLRKRLYRSLFRKTGKGVIFGRSLTLNHADRITLGDNVMLDQHSLLDARGAGDAGVTIGDRVIINRGAAIQAKVGHIRIGNDCSIGAGVDMVAQGPIILDDNVSVAGKATIAGGRYVVEQEENAPGAKQRFSGGAIHIKSNTRIGMGAIIQDGVTIGENAIVAPGSVVFEDVPAHTVVWGNPARPVRHRSSKSVAPHEQRQTSKLPTVKSAQLHQQVRNYLEDDLFIEFGPDGFNNSDSLIDTGIMDSLALVRLLSWTEKQFNVDLDFANLDTSDIDAVDKIVARINERI